MSSTVPTYFRTAVSEEDLAPIGNPDVDVEQMEPGKPFIFTATVEVRPRLELTAADYEGLQVTRPPVEATDDEVDAWQERLQRQFAELEPVTRPAQESDFVTVNVTVTKDGQEVDSLTREDYLYSVGSGELGEAMDQQLPGKKPGDILDFDGTLPPSLPEDLAGAAAHFTVLVKDVKALKLPDADDDFATTASEFDTLEELRGDLREKIHEAKERESEGVIRDRALQAMIDRVDVELPDSLIEDETSHRMQHAEERAVRYGLSLDQMLELQGWDRRSSRRGQPRPRGARHQGGSGPRGDREVREDRDHRGGDRGRDRFPGTGLRPRSEGIGDPTRPERPDRHAGRGYHQVEGPQHPRGARRDQ